MKITIKILFVICSCFVMHNTWGEDHYYFFSEKDIQNIKASSETEWGKKIINNLLTEVEERRQHPLRVPLLEGGHLHHYFCPVHNVMFEFAWDLPDKHYCKTCRKYWENNNQFDWAWVNVLHANNLRYLTANMYLYIATKDTIYAAYIKDMLLDYAAKYPTYFEHNTDRKATALNSGRMFGQSLDESVWASDAARAYLIAKDIMTTDEIAKIKKGYLEICAQMLLKRRGGGNWQVWHNSGLAALGIALENDSIIDIALNDSQCGYHQMMKNHVYDDGWWNEGSPIYHYYPLRAMLLTADAVRCRGIDLYDEKLYNMFASPAKGVYADLTFPAHNDGWYGESLIDQVRLYEIAYQRYNKDPFLLNILLNCYCFSERRVPEALLNQCDVVCDKTNKIFQSVCFQNLGVAILRSDTKSVVLKYGPHGGGHGHPDKLSISVHNGEKELITDMGTSAYGVPDFINWYRKTLSHSTVVVDSKDQKETTGQLVFFNPGSNGGSVKAETKTAYPGVDMSRELKLKGNILTDIFLVSSSENHQYDYVLILTEKPIYKETGEDVVLNGSNTYKRISNIKKIKTGKSFKFKSEGGSEFEFQSLNGADFEVFIGEAPGIPPKNPESKEEYKLSVSYPLIIRTNNENMKIKTMMKIK